MASETKTTSTLNITFQDEFNQLDFTYKIDNPKSGITLNNIRNIYKELFDADLMYNKNLEKQVAVYSAQYVTTTTTKTDVE